MKAKMLWWDGDRRIVRLPNNEFVVEKAVLDALGEKSWRLVSGPCSRPSKIWFAPSSAGAEGRGGPVTKFQPLLAGPAPDDLSLLRYPVLASPKLDGIRCVKVGGRALTRKGVI